MVCLFLNGDFFHGYVSHNQMAGKDLFHLMVHHSGIVNTHQGDTILGYHMVSPSVQSPIGQSSPRFELWAFIVSPFDTQRAIVP